MKNTFVMFLQVVVSLYIQFHGGFTSWNYNVCVNLHSTPAELAKPPFLNIVFYYEIWSYGKQR